MKLVYFKPVFVWSESEKRMRLFRVLFSGLTRSGVGWSGWRCISFALTPRFLKFRRGVFDWDVTLLGLRVHYKGRMGGRRV